MASWFEEPRDKERVRLVESDLALTNDFIKGVVATGSAIRGTAVTIWLALVGIALQQDIASLAALGAIVAAVFWLIDGYHGWLYTEGVHPCSGLRKVCSRSTTTRSAVAMTIPVR